MYMDESLRGFLNTMPVTLVLGDSADVSRYRFLMQITDCFRMKRELFNHYVMERIRVVVYPKRVGSNLYVVDMDQNIIVENDLEQRLKQRDKKILSLIVPGNDRKQSELMEFPCTWTEDFEFTFSERLTKVLLFESFPHGKKSFEQLLKDVVHFYPYYVCCKVILYKKDIRYGATDITSEDEVVQNALEKLRGYTEDIQIMTENLDVEKCTDSSIHLKFQYRNKKRILIERRLEELKNSFDLQYQYLFERFLIDEGKKGYGILSNQSFSEAVRFEKVKGTKDIERRILQNYLKIMDDNRSYLIQFLRRIYEEFWSEMIDAGEEKCFEKYADRVVKALQDNYIFHKRKGCPDEPIEYRKLCDAEAYQVILGRHVMKYFETILKEEIQKEIHEKLIECEGKYK